MAEALRTALYDRHIQAKARIVEFGGWAMPVQYSGILDEHRHVRSSCGLFDLSHMGEFMATGPNSLGDLERLLTNDLGGAAVGQCVYSPMCNERGGVVDDLLVYRLADSITMLVVNASNREKDLEWMRARVSPGTEISDRSLDTSLLALQGPMAAAVMADHCPQALELKSYRLRWTDIAGRGVLVSRTGYTGEDGFEIYCNNQAAPILWDVLMADQRVKPIGLGARDTLRFEARLMLYGNDLDEETTPLEAGLGWTVKFDKPAAFIGREALLRQRAEAPARQLVGFRMMGRGIARHGYPIVAGGQPIGHVASGAYSPTLDEPLGLGFVTKPHSAPGSRFEIRIRNADVTAEVVKTPFYRRPKG